MSMPRSFRNRSRPHPTLQCFEYKIQTYLLRFNFIWSPVNWRVESRLGNEDFRPSQIRSCNVASSVSASARQDLITQDPVCRQVQEKILQRKMEFECVWTRRNFPKENLTRTLMASPNSTISPPKSPSMTIRKMTIVRSPEGARHYKHRYTSCRQI